MIILSYLYTVYINLEDKYHNFILLFNLIILRYYSCVLNLKLLLFSVKVIFGSYASAMSDYYALKYIILSQYRQKILLQTPNSLGVFQDMFLNLYP